MLKPRPLSALNTLAFFQAETSTLSLGAETSYHRDLPLQDMRISITETSAQQAGESHAAMHAVKGMASTGHGVSCPVPGAT